MATNDIVLLVILILFLLSGIISGFIKSVGKIFSLAGAALLSFYCGGLISKTFIENVDSIGTFVSENGYGGSLILIASYIVTFLVSFLVLKIIVKAFSNVVKATKAGKAIDRILGAVSGIALGLVICDLYVRALYGVACANPDTASWVISDAQLGIENGVTFTKMIMNLNLSAIGQTFPGL